MLKIFVCTCILYILSSVISKSERNITCYNFYKYLLTIIGNISHDKLLDAVINGIDNYKNINVIYQKIDNYAFKIKL